MRKRLPIAEGLLLFLIVTLSMPQPAHAYFDLGMGTYMLQVIFAFGAAYWLSFKKWWGGKPKSGGHTAGTDTTQEEADSRAVQASQAATRDLIETSAQSPTEKADPLA